MSKNQLYGFNFWKNWHCKFPFEELPVQGEPQRTLISEPRIEQLAKRLNLKGAHILELGCLEGMHSLILQNLGAKEIIAIEGREENFLKCLIVKNAFKLDNCKFLFGNIDDILGSLSRKFDLCLALGVLYHLDDPISVVYRISELTDKLFVWTHYCSEDYPEGPTSEIRYRGSIYRGRTVGEDLEDYLSGLDGESFWMFEDDLLKLTKDAGFQNIDLIEKEKHAHGPAMTFLAQK